MTISKKLREQLLKLCGSLSDDDGLNAKDFHKHNTDRKRSDEHKQLRLCQQVSHTLMHVLPTSREERLRELRIERVSPGQASAALTVYLATPTDVDADSCRCIVELLKTHEGWLRSEVAAAITRKKVPRLVFEFVSPRNSEEASDA